MLLTTIDPFVQEFERQFENLDRIARRVWGETTAGASVIPMDGVRRKDDVLLRFDLPGMDPGSIDVTVDRNVLTISARREEELEHDDRHFVRERLTGAFTRRVYLPDHLDADRIEADYDNGVLTVRIPLLEQAKPRKVEIRGGRRKALKA